MTSRFTLLHDKNDTLNDRRKVPLVGSGQIPSGQLIHIVLPVFGHHRAQSQEMGILFHHASPCLDIVGLLIGILCRTTLCSKIKSVFAGSVNCSGASDPTMGGNGFSVAIFFYVHRAAAILDRHPSTKIQSRPRQPRHKVPQQEKSNHLLFARVIPLLPFRRA